MGASGERTDHVWVWCVLKQRRSNPPVTISERWRLGPADTMWAGAPAYVAACGVSILLGSLPATAENGTRPHPSTIESAIECALLTSTQRPFSRIGESRDLMSGLATG